MSRRPDYLACMHVALPMSAPELLLLKRLCKKKNSKAKTKAIGHDVHNISPIHTVIVRFSCRNGLASVACNRVLRKPRLCAVPLSLFIETSQQTICSSVPSFQRTAPSYTCCDNAQAEAQEEFVVSSCQAKYSLLVCLVCLQPDVWLRARQRSRQARPRSTRRCGGATAAV